MIRWAKSRLSVAAFAFGTVFACGPRTEGLDTSKLPDDMKSEYQLFAVRCSKCHSLARALNAGITDDQQWIDYVNRMRRQPGSGISYDDQAHILRFLKWYAAETRRQKAEKNGELPPVATSAAPAASTAPPRPTPAAPADGGQ